MEREKVTLSLKDRIILYNQYLILEKLCPDEAAGFKEKRHIVEHGYELHYTDLNVIAAESTLTADVSHEVMDILDMFRALNDSYSRLENKEGIDKKRIQFEGFDGNSTKGHFGYACFLVLTQGRWEEVIEGRPGFDLNSHSSVLEMYRRMLESWASLDKKFTLTSEELKQVLAARIHPENRR